MANRTAIIEETTRGGHIVLESLARKYDATVVHVNDGPFEVELKPRTQPNITLDDAVNTGLNIEKNGYKVRRVGSTFKVYAEESLDYLGGFDIEKGTFGFMLNQIENPAFLNLIGNLYGLDPSLLESTDSDGEDRLAPGLIHLDEKITKTGEGLHEALSLEKLLNRADFVNIIVKNLSTLDDVLEHLHRVYFEELLSHKIRKTIFITITIRFFRKINKYIDSLI